MRSEIEQLIETELNGIVENAMELVERIPRPVRYIGEGFMSIEGRSALMINQRCNEIRRILYGAKLI